jgi:methyl-accepting chemotaxis protein
MGELMFFVNLKVKSRLTIGSIISVSVIVIIALYATLKMESLSQLTDKLYKHPYTVSVSLLKIKNSMTAIHRSMKDVALAKSENDIQSALSIINTEEASAFEQSILLEERFLGDKSKVLEMKKLMTDWRDIRDRVVGFMEKGDNNSATQITKNEGANHVKKIYGSIIYLENFAENKAKQFVDNAHSILSTTELFFILLVALGALITIIINYIITRSIIIPLGSEPVVLSGIANAISQGDLTSKIIESDKNSGIYLSMQRMQEKLNTLISEIFATSELLKNEASSVSTISESTSTIIREESTQIERVASAITQMSANIEHIAQSAKETAAAAEKVSEGTINGQEVVSKTVKSINEMQVIVGESTVSIRELVENSNKIGAVVDVIKGISDQTNLLALNAAIEAARAGEQGRGFAVVADEVRELAKRTNDATINIQGMIDKLQSDAESSATKMESSLAIADSTSLSAKNMDEVLNSIILGINEISDMNIHMASSITQQSSAANEISDSVHSISALSIKTSDGATHSLQASKEVFELVNGLVELIATFKIKEPTTQSQ